MPTNIELEKQIESLTKAVTGLEVAIDEMRKVIARLAQENNSTISNVNKLATDVQQVQGEAAQAKSEINRLVEMYRAGQYARP